MDEEADKRPMRTVTGTLRRRLGDDAQNLAYIFTEPRVGYRIGRGRRRRRQGKRMLCHMLRRTYFTPLSTLPLVCAR